MVIDSKSVAKIVTAETAQPAYSGVIAIRKNGRAVFEQAFGWANRADEIPNRMNTRFAMASGCKIFTAVAVGQLIDNGSLAFDTRLADCLNISFPHFDPEVRVHHLLTHTSGIPDYFDEQTMDDYAALWRERPMYTIRSPHDFLPMFQNEKMRFPPGEKFHYSESGFIVLGLIIEQLSGLSFQDCVTRNVLQRADMNDSGYFATDQLPPHTALNYIYDKASDAWRTNIFSVPIVGAPDGGAFTTAADMSRFWDALLQHRLLSRETTELMMQPHVSAAAEGPNIYYGYGVWITQRDDRILSHGVMGYDPGVAMKSYVFDGTGFEITMLANTSEELWPVYRKIVQALGLE
jgi:CubicO group peptidase (beta-lactamase class C family)